MNSDIAVIYVRTASMEVSASGAGLAAAIQETDASVKCPSIELGGKIELGLLLELRSAIIQSEGDRESGQDLGQPQPLERSLAALRRRLS